MLRTVLKGMSKQGKRL